MICEFIVIEPGGDDTGKAQSSKLKIQNPKLETWNWEFEIRNKTKTLNLKFETEKFQAFHFPLFPLHS